MNVIHIEIETAIRNVSWYTQQVGQKSLHRITIDFDAKTVTDQVLTGDDQNYASGTKEYQR